MRARRCNSMQCHKALRTTYYPPGTTQNRSHPHHHHYTFRLYYNPPVQSSCNPHQVSLPIKPHAIQKCTQRLHFLTLLQLIFCSGLRYFPPRYLERGRKWAFEGPKVSDLPLFTPRRWLQKLLPVPFISPRIMMDQCARESVQKVCMLLLCQKIITTSEGLRTLRYY